MLNQTITAYKVHASGNDFVLLEQDISMMPDFAGWVRRVCDRKFGVGSDGVICVDLESNPPRFRMWNPDGSQSEMCGNGLRCTMRWILDHGLVLDKIATDAGVLQVHNPENGGEIDLGPAKFLPSIIPCEFLGEEFMDQPFVVPIGSENLELRLSAVSFGNPHVVFYGEHCTEDFIQIAKFLQANPLFPASVNVHQMQIIEPNWVRMQTYERGAGITFACGSGACAVATLHRKLEKLAGNNPPENYKIEMPGGPVTVRLKPTGHAGLSGPASVVAELKF